MRKTAIFLSSIIASLFIGMTSTFACSCMMPESPEKELEKTPLVFIGKVINIKNTTIVDDLIGSIYEKKVIFNVESNIKGNTSKTITINTADSSAACGYNFEKNKEYIVYAYGENGEYSANICSRTNLIENAKEDLEAFKDKIENKKDNNKFEEKTRKTSFREILIILIFITTVIIFVLLTANRRTKEYK